MKPILADVNVRLATFVAEHPHHEAANRWCCRVALGVLFHVATRSRFILPLPDGLVPDRPFPCYL